jgi:hypothetical protein
MEDKYLTYLVLFGLGFFLKYSINQNFEYFRYDYDKAFDNSDHEWSRDPVQYCPMFCDVRNFTKPEERLRHGGCGPACAECHTDPLTKDGVWCNPTTTTNIVCATMTDNTKRCMGSEECEKLNNMDCSGPKYVDKLECILDCEDSSLEIDKTINISGRSNSRSRSGRSRSDRNRSRSRSRSRSRIGAGKTRKERNMHVKGIDIKKINKDKFILKANSDIECKTVSSGHKTL